MDIGGGVCDFGAPRIHHRQVSMPCIVRCSWHRLVFLLFHPEATPQTPFLLTPFLILCPCKASLESDKLVQVLWLHRLFGSGIKNVAITPAEHEDSGSCFWSCLSDCVRAFLLSCQTYKMMPTKCTTKHKTCHMLHLPCESSTYFLPSPFLPLPLLPLIPLQPLSVALVWLPSSKLCLHWSSVCRDRTRLLLHLLRLHVISILLLQDSL